MAALWNQLRDFFIVGLLLLTGFFFLIGANESMSLGLRTIALEISGVVEKRLAWLGTLTFALTENERLRQENALLTSDLAQTRVALLENQRLKDALALKQDSTLQLVAARIVARDPFGQSNYFTLDVGRTDGVDIDMAVVGIEGILGRVVHVSSNYSRVMSYLNTDFYVPAMIEPLFAAGMISWSGTQRDALTLENVVNTEPVAPGQRVVTHQASEVFPPFLAVGTVSAVAPRPSLNAWEIEVEPASKLNSVQFAFVVLGHRDLQQVEIQNAPIR